jgi:CheY-like chemotaxis protein
MSSVVLRNRPTGRRLGMSAKVLLIDDDRDFRVSVKSLLESGGYEVAEADSGHAGLSKVLEYKPDVIVLDIMMESCTEGYGITYALKYLDEYTEFRGIPVFMVSSIQETPDERFPMSAEVEMIRPDRYFTKPLDIPRFLQLLEKALAASVATT